MLDINTKINIQSTKEIVNEIKDDYHYIICTEGERYDYLRNRDNVLVLNFADTELESKKDAFSAQHSNKVKRFLEAHCISNLYITCEAGESRSAGIAAGLLSINDGDDYIWKSKYQPNVLVYKTIMQTLYPHDSRDKIELIDEFLSPRGYARFRSINPDNRYAGYDDLFEPDREKGQNIKYGLLYGSSRNLVIFIKAGRDSTLDKENIKYLKVAADLVSNHYVSVIVATTPHDKTYQFHSDAEFLNGFFENEGIAPQERKVLYFGHSDGASAAVFRNNKQIIDDMFRAFIFSGLPLYQNNRDFGKVLSNLKVINESKFLTLVYGERDKSYERFSPQLIGLAPEIDIRVVAGEDHNYSSNRKIIHAIPELFFDDNALEDNGIQAYDG